MGTSDTWTNKQLIGLFQQALTPGTEATNAEVAGTLISMRMPKVYSYMGWLFVLIGWMHLILLTPWGGNDWPVWLILAAAAFYGTLGVWVILFIKYHRVLYDAMGFHRIGLFGRIKSYHWTDMRSATLLRQGRVMVLRTANGRKVELYATMLGFKGFLAVTQKHCPIISKERGILPGQWTEKPWHGA